MPREIEENGLLLTDGRCFEHYFRPASVESMRRNLIFLLDTSTSMQYDNKLDKAKQALTGFIETIKPEETFSIQAFGNKGTEALWGTGSGTDDDKEEAKQFVNALRASSYSTNLHEAVLEGLLRAKHDAETSEDDIVTVLVLLSDAYSSRGELNRRKIAEHVFELNSERKVKIFNLGFQDSADMQLLDAIALVSFVSCCQELHIFIYLCG